MKFLRCEVENFASYKLLSFDFQNQGLCLISGPTGSGKSTLCDIATWILFGRTSKNGAVDEIRSWNSDKPTFGRLEVEINGKTICITRQRGDAAKDNDLYYWTMPWLNPSNPGHIRGRDLNDTQKLLNEIIGVDLDLFLSGAYFHEFSQTAQFFTANAKTRRQLTEQLVDLSLATSLTEKISEYKKEVKKVQIGLSQELVVLENSYALTESSLQSERTKAFQWNKQKELKVQALKDTSAYYQEKLLKQYERDLLNFEQTRLSIETDIVDLESDIVPEEELQEREMKLANLKAYSKPTICSECGNVKNRDKELVINREEYTISQIEANNIKKKLQLRGVKDKLKRHMEGEMNIKKSPATNPYVQQLQDILDEENPHEASVIMFVVKKNNFLKQKEDVESSLQAFLIEHNDLEILLDVVADFRSILIKNTVVDLEQNTNKILNDYFDAEIRVKFDIADSDRLEIVIWKDGNEASYTQLSKGQRQLLKLSFSVSVMRCVQNHHGVDFNAIFMDESMDGMDENLKVKAYGLLQGLALEHESVFVVEHSTELKTLFTNRYNVTLADEGSQLERA